MLFSVSVCGCAVFLNSFCWFYGWCLLANGLLFGISVFGMVGWCVLCLVLWLRFLGNVFVLCVISRFVFGVFWGSVYVVVLWRV